MNSQLQVCPVCGGRRVQQKAWIDQFLPAKAREYAVSPEGLSGFSG